MTAKTIAMANILKVLEKAGLFFVVILEDEWSTSSRLLEQT